MPFDTSHSLRTHLQTIADPAYAAFSVRLIPDLKRELLGVRIPVLRQLARQMAKAHAPQALDTILCGQSQEEVMLRGLAIGYAPMQWVEFAQRVNGYVPLIDNWAVCDTVCTSLTLVRSHCEEGWQLLQPHWESQETYRQRFGIVMLMDHYLNEVYSQQVLEVLRRLRPNGYYAAMAAGWALQAAFVRWPEQTMTVLADNETDGEVRRLARKKLLESLRTPAEWRERIKRLP